MKQNNNNYKSIKGFIISILSLLAYNSFGQLHENVTINTPLARDEVIYASGMVTFGNGFSTGSHDMSVTTGSHHYKKAELTSGKSYIHAIQPRVEVTETDMNNLFDGNSSNDPALYIRDIHEQVSYIDGLGRVKQNISIMGGSTGEDLVSFGNFQNFDDEYLLYNSLKTTGGANFKGKMAKSYLPYSTIKMGTEANWLPGVYNTDPINDQTNFYTGLFGTEGNKAYSQSFVESLTGAVKEQGSTGASWQPTDNSGSSNGHTNKIKYTTNTTTLNFWHLPGKNQTSYQEMLTGFTLKTGTEAYSAGTVSVEEVKSVNWQNGQTGGIFRVFKNRLGKTIKKEAVNGDGTVLATRYVYDDLGLLRCIMPPAASSPTDKDYCYYFSYDSYRRLVEKKVPGSGSVEYCYDKRGRVAAIRDSTLRSQGRWQITKYDKLNRPILTGFYTSSLPREILENQIRNYTGSNLYENRGSTVLGYTCRSFPNTLTSENSYLTVTYYDDYSFPGTIAYNTANVSFLDAGDKSNQTTGMVTGSKTKIMDPATDMPDWLISVVYYDKFGRIIQTIGKNHMGGTDRISNHLNYAGELIESITEHNITGNSVTLKNEYTYDHKGRVKDEYYQVNSNEKVKTKSYEYNKLGQVVAIYTHINSGENKEDALQKTDYEYNMKGWLTSINDPDNLGDDVFAMKLAYNEYSGMSNALPANEKETYFNGNISVAEWISKTNSGQQPLAAYAYKYDKLNYLTSASYGDVNNWGGWGNDLRNVVYDNNGNIVSFERYNSNGSEMDELALTYSGNQLSTVFENGDRTKGFITDGNTTPYAYDGNGNMTDDHYKGISITYNYLNLPKQVSYGTDIAEYYYDIAGIKLRIDVEEDIGGSTQYNTVDYVGSFVYHNGSLAYISTSFGRIVHTSGSYNYEYFMRDYLGNIRAFYRENGGTLDVMQLANYYPFGERFDETLPGTDNNYLFNGKEWQNYFSNHNLNFYDFGSRYYDPILGRWHSVDPMAISVAGMSPYCGMGNNPVVYVDPDGELFWVAIAIGAAIGAWKGHKIAQSKGKKGWDAFWHILGGAVIGGVAGQFGAAAFTYASIGGANMITAGAFSGMIGGGITGGGYAALSGASGIDIVGGMMQGMALGAIGGAAVSGALAGIGGLPAGDRMGLGDGNMLINPTVADRAQHLLGNISFEGLSGGLSGIFGREMIDMIYLGGQYKRGVKRSQFFKYQNRVYDGTAPAWMERNYYNWYSASSIDLYPSSACDAKIDVNNTYYLGDKATNVRIDAYGEVKDELTVNLKWDGFDQTYVTGDRIDIRTKNLNINKVLHRAYGIFKCGDGVRTLWNFSKPTFDINYQIPIK